MAVTPIPAHSSLKSHEPSLGRISQSVKLSYMFKNGYYIQIDFFFFFPSIEGLSVLWLSLNYFKFRKIQLIK